MKKEESNGVAKTAPTVIVEKTLADNVLNKVNAFAQMGALKLPSDYSAANALKLAWLMLQQAVDTNKRPVLESCSKESIANAFLEMCMQGLNPMKKQCYFIAYGDKLTMQRSYQGAIAVAKRVAPVLAVHANVIYQDDIFEYAIDQATGTKKVTKHDQKIENIDLNKIRGAYAVATFENGTSDMEAMTILQIKKAWAQGFGGGNTKAHQNFTDEMCKKTVIGRLCKTIINNSDDSALFKDEEEPTDTVAMTIINEEIKENANKEQIGLEVSTEKQKQDEPEKLNEDIAYSISIYLSDCKTMVEIEKVIALYPELKGNEEFENMINSAKRKVASSKAKPGF